MLHQRGLARAVDSQNTVDFPLKKAQVAILKHGFSSESLAQILCVYDYFHYNLLSLIPTVGMNRCLNLTALLRQLNRRFTCFYDISR